MFVQRTGHRHGDIALACEDVGYFLPAADQGDQVAAGQSGLVHAEFDGVDGGGHANRVVLVLVMLDEVGQHVEFIAFGGVQLRAHQLANAGAGRFVVLLAPDWSDGVHGYTSVASMRLYSAWVPRKSM